MATSRFDRVYRDHRAFVCRTVRRLGAPAAEVDDIVQDVFLVVHRRLDEFQDRATITTWLFAIAAHVVRDRRRRALNQRRRDAHLIPDRGSVELDREVACAETVSLLANLLHELEPAQRDALVMADLLRMTVPEIAVQQHAKLNTAYSRVRLGRRALQSALATYRRRPRAELPLP